MRLATPIRPTPKPRKPFTAGPFIGMRDSLDPSSARPELARLLENCYPLDPQFGGAIVGRPGFTLTTGQGGSGGARTGQLLYQFTKKDGTEYTVRIIGGKLETYNWGTDTWSNVVTAANFATASITLSTTARCYAITFNDTMLVTDGVNKPWTWDGQSGAGGLVPLTNASVIFGPPWIYYAKWFGVKNAARGTIIWSEENQANTGFEAGGYNNAWAIGQTDQNAVTRGVGTNEAMYIFRARSITAIAGAVTPDFATSGTREGVSETVGTTSPASVFTVTKEDGGTRMIGFADADGKPRAIIPGGGVVSLWNDYRETIGGFDPAQIDDCEGFYDPALELARFGFAQTAATRRNAQLCYHMRGALPQACGIFKGYDFDRIAAVKNANGEPTVMHLDGNGYAYYHGAAWNDGKQTGTVAIGHLVEGPAVGTDNFIEKNWDLIDFTFRTMSDMTGMTVRHETPRGASVAQSISLESALARWDEAFWDVDFWSANAVDQHVAVGIFANGRWLVWRLQHEGLGEQFGFTSATAWASVVGRFPGTP